MVASSLPRVGWVVDIVNENACALDVDAASDPVAIAPPSRTVRPKFLYRLATPARRARSHAERSPRGRVVEIARDIEVAGICACTSHGRGNKGAKQEPE